MPPIDSRIVYEGRYAVDAAGAIRLGFPGVTAHLRLRGRLLALRASASSADVFFDVGIDGADPTPLRLRSGEGYLPLLHNERSAEHIIMLTRRTESWQGPCALIDFDPGPDGELLPPTPLPARRLLFIGDSVTSGEMTAYEPGRAMTDKANSNARLSYGVILSRRLGAQCHLVSYGGRGLIRDWQGIRDTRNAPQFYELALPDDPTVRWDHSRYVPDAIGIQLGTNDFSSDIPEQKEFVDAYVEFLRKVRRDAPQTAIFLMNSPIVEDDPIRGPRQTTLHAFLQEVIARVDDRKIQLVSLNHYPGVPGNGHPTGQEHEAIASELEPVFRQALGW